MTVYDLIERIERLEKRVERLEWPTRVLAERVRQDQIPDHSHKQNPFTQPHICTWVHRPASSGEPFVCVECGAESKEWPRRDL